MTSGYVKKISKWNTGDQFVDHHLMPLVHCIIDTLRAEFPGRGWAPRYRFLCDFLYPWRLGNPLNSGFCIAQISLRKEGCIQLLVRFPFSIFLYINLDFLVCKWQNRNAAWTGTTTKENNLLDNMQSRHPAFFKGNRKILLCKFIESILFF